MLLQLPLHFIFLLLLPLAFSSFIAKPGCHERCGSLLIAFPFGVGSNCSLEQSFNIICDNSTDPPKAYLFTSNKTEVIEIKPLPGSLEQLHSNPRNYEASLSQIRVKYPYLLNFACYDTPGSSRNGTRDDLFYGVTMGETQYTLSDQNWLTAIGCDDLVLGLGLGNKTFGGGCVSYCQNVTDTGGVGVCPNNNNNGYSSGNGCCRTPIPAGADFLGAQLTDLSEKWGRKKQFSCSYAFVEEEVISNQSQNISYPLLSSNNSKEFIYDGRGWITSAPPVVRFDWRIGSDDCRQANRSTTYACRDNSECVDVDANVRGYLCRCLKGYEGNPYLTPGCVARGGTYSGDGRLDGSGCIRRQSSSKTINVLIGLGSGLGFLLLLSMYFWLHKVLQKRKSKMRKEKFFKRNGGLLLQQKTNEGTLGKIKLFPAKELERATDHFNESRILGQGGQGTVYKGMLFDGKIVAIKKLKQVDEDQLEQFINEVVILSQVNHRNVVKLLGCCLETEIPLLVYEFMPSGTLFDLIHDSTSEILFSWNMSLKIAIDVAGAVAYLHYASSLPIYHRDIKSSNILLDEKYIAKVSDFGTSKSFAVDQTHLTTMVKGTIGYLDPEYFQSSQFTEKCDVYSFGVVLVELVTGRRPISLNRSKEEGSLVTQFLTSMEANNLDTILDPQVLKQSRKEEVIAVARLAQRCLNLKGRMRPTMKEVATELESLRISQMPSTVKDEFEEARVYEAKPIMISDIEYTWTTASGNSVASSSSDTHPLMFATK